MPKIFSFSGKTMKLNIANKTHYNFRYIIIWKNLCLKHIHIKAYIHLENRMEKIQQNINVVEMWDCDWFFSFTFFHVSSRSMGVFFLYNQQKINFKNRYDIFNMSFFLFQMLRSLEFSIYEMNQHTLVLTLGYILFHLSLLLQLCFYSLHRNAILPSGYNLIEIFYIVLSSLFLVWLPIFLFIWTCMF